MSSDGSSFGSAGLYVGTDWQVRCSTYPDSTPILSIDAGRTVMSVSITPLKQMGDEAVAFARALARHAALFAADCERLHAEQHGQACGEGHPPADDAA